LALASGNCWKKENCDWFSPPETVGRRRTVIGSRCRGAGRSARGPSAAAAGLCRHVGRARCGPERAARGGGRVGCVSMSHGSSFPFPGNFDGGYGPAGGYTQSPGGFSSPTGAQAEKKQVGPGGAGEAGGCGAALS